MFSTKFKKSLKKIQKQNKNIDDLLDVIDRLAFKEELDQKYRNHKLIDDKNYKNCYETNFGEKSGEFYTQKVYIDGELVYDGDYNKEQWDDFINKYLSNLKYFCIGRSSMSDDGSWWYSKMNAYCLRLYSRGLTEEEVRANYEKATKYHSLLESE